MSYFTINNFFRVCIILLIFYFKKSWKISVTNCIRIVLHVVIMYIEYICKKQLGNINSVLRIPFYQADRLAISSHLFFSISRDRISQKVEVT